MTKTNDEFIGPTCNFPTLLFKLKQNKWFLVHNCKINVFQSSECSQFFNRKRQRKQMNTWFVIYYNAQWDKKKHTNKRCWKCKKWKRSREKTTFHNFVKTNDTILKLPYQWQPWSNKYIWRIVLTLPYRWKFPQTYINWRKYDEKKTNLTG